jgi:hypothetical protein
MKWEGFGWTTAVGAWTAALALIGIIVRQIGPWRKQSMDAEKVFRDGLVLRVQKLEHDIKFQQIRHDAEMAVARHRLNNVTQCFDALMLLLKAAPEKAAEAIVHIERMRKDQLAAEAIEKVEIHKIMMDAIAAEAAVGHNGPTTEHWGGDENAGQSN